MNSGIVLAAPIILNTARNILHAVRGPRRLNAGLKNRMVHSWPGLCVEAAGAPVRHVRLPTEDEQHVDPAGPGAHRAPVLLHPHPHYGVLEVLWEKADYYKANNRRYKNRPAQS